MHICDYVSRQIAWSKGTFGPGERTEGVLDHIEKEIEEVRADPDDVMEFIDIVILAIDGAWRRLVHQGLTEREACEKIEMLLEEKYWTNSFREWPNWRLVEPGKAIEHVKK